MNKFYNLFHFAKVNVLKEIDDNGVKDTDDDPWIDDHKTIVWSG